jgi:uncharacterized membrane protein
MSNALAVILHLLAINVWLGGNFFAVVVLYDAAAVFTSTQRQQLMDTVLRRFFTLIWCAMVLLLSSGGWMIHSRFGGPATMPLYVQLMAGFGLSMSLVFLVTFFGPYQGYRRARRQQDLDSGRWHLAHIRQLSILSIVLGICVVLVVGGGPHLLA